MKNRKGFTLIELMIVVAIIGILAAIAIPQFSSYRTRAFNSAAISDLKNLATAQEAYYVDNATYAGDAAGLVLLAGYGQVTSDGVEVLLLTGDGTAWTATAEHDNGDLYNWDSAAGGLQ